MNITQRRKNKKFMKENLTSSLDTAMQLSGALAAMVVDLESGMILGKVGGGFDLDVAAAGNSEVLKAKMRTAEMLGLNQKVEDVLITLENQYHVIRPVVSNSHPIFIYVALDKSKANLALTRIKITEIEKNLKI
jgi:predicted regulator of Ras-like GTPase activity (Roadblock/LC7/MglB family)